MSESSEEKPRDRRSSRGDGAIYWDKARNRYTGVISLGYTASGRRRRVYVRATTKTELRRKMREARKELELGVKPAALYTVAQAVNDWLDRGLKGRSDETVEKYRSLADNHIIPKVGKAKLRDLTADDVDDWLDGEAPNLASRSLRECLSVLRRAIRLAQRREKVGRNVAELVTDLPVGRNGRPSQALTVDQARAVLDAAKGHPLHAYVVVCLMTGIRTEEARALTWDRVHLDPPDDLPPHIEVWRSVRRHGDTKTKKSRRTLGLPPAAVDALRAHHARQDSLSNSEGRRPTALVFSSQAGTPLDAANVRRGFRAITKKAGLTYRWTPRELRHSFVSLMSANGVAIEDIARLVGHSSSATTEAVYRKELRPVIARGAEVMDTLFTDSTPQTDDA